MKVTRREFLASMSALTAAGFLPLSKLVARDEVDGFKMLRRNVGTYVNRGGTMGWMVNDDAVVVVDTQFPESAQVFWDGLSKKTTRGIDVLINSHHHGDHTAGNITLKPHAGMSVAHENVPKLQKRQATQRGTVDKQAYAETLYKDIWSKDVGDEVVSLKHYGNAHTSGDSVIHFQKADVVHMGDLVFNRMGAFIDRGAGASIKGWIKTMKAVHDDYTDETLFIFGHGGPAFGVTGGRKDLLVMADFLNGLLEYASAGIKAGKTMEQIAETEKLPKFPDHYLDSWKAAIPNCLKVAYQELTEDK